MSNSDPVVAFVIPSTEDMTRLTPSRINPAIGVARMDSRDLLWGHGNVSVEFHNFAHGRPCPGCDCPCRQPEGGNR